MPTVQWAGQRLTPACRTEVTGIDARVVAWPLRQRPGSAGLHSPAPPLQAHVRARAPRSHGLFPCALVPLCPCALVHVRVFALARFYTGAKVDWCGAKCRGHAPADIKQAALLFNRHFAALCRRRTPTGLLTSVLCVVLCCVVLCRCPARTPSRSSCACCLARRPASTTRSCPSTCGSRTSSSPSPGPSEAVRSSVFK